MDIQKIRQDTPLHQQYAYINTAAASAPPQQVIDAMTGYLQKTTSVGPYLPAFRREVYAKVDEIRAKTAAFIGAKPSEIAFTKNGTEAINFVASGLNWNEGDQVILADLEFHSNYVPWLKLQNDRNVKLTVLKTDKSGVIRLDALEQAITPNTKLITVSHLPNASGALQPVKEICQLARRRGVLSLINASQTLGLVPLDVSELECDFLAACGRKWLRGPEGSGVLYIREERIGSITPTLIGWGGTSWDFDTNEYSYLPIAKRVEAGCPIIPSILGLGAAIEYADEIGIKAIYERVKKLTRYTVDKMSTVPGMEIYGPEDINNRLAIIPFNIAGLTPDRITEYLEEHHIIIEAGTFMANTMLQQYGINKMARFSPHYFNTVEEIDRAVELMISLVEQEGK
ncbi:aminotransferase class V-fold PLP-dependent enzyme [Brevibacillus humidisoli]|uniref:aminotransferase class V-fold PLP-dependent enzyme n=1 Tax=Brevibacillus humidisoli TaxID=2895522 RepID=UPI001E5DFB00|nr:aminotransferase class V-fold PLP-dependent enzyme [Brevibacillus humidisoli]UFJ39259.1 aminotransferase class V-fold PLP-dependent enzyme [Brevibacillus humidisoli]